jgi:hypothetical protein
MRLLAQQFLNARHPRRIIGSYHHWSKPFIGSEAFQEGKSSKKKNRAKPSGFIPRPRAKVTKPKKP